MTEVNAATRTQTLALVKVAPHQVFLCRVLDLDGVCLTRYAALERFGGWRKAAEIQCAVEDLQTSPVPECALRVRAVGPNQGDGFGVAFDIPLQRGLELRDFVAHAVASPDANVVSIGFEPVRNGGAWSAGVDGYQVAVESQTYSGGRFYRVVEDCSNARCEWRVVDEAAALMWSD
jgi:hypothetical protein